MSVKSFFSKFFSWFPITIFCVLIVSIVVGLVSWTFGADPIIFGFWTALGLLAMMILYVWGRSLWWWITGKGFSGDKKE